MEETGSKRTATAEIREKLRLSNLLVSFVIVILLFVILRYLYAPVRLLLGFLPDTSMILIAAFAVIVAFAGLYLSKVMSKQVIRKIEDYTKQLDGLLAVMKDIREEIYGDVLLEKIMNCSLAITGSAQGSILLADKDTLIFKIVKGTISGGLPGRPVSKETGIAGWVLKHGEPAVVEDVKRDGRYDPGCDGFTGCQIHSMLCVPLKTKSSTIGVIELLNKKQGVYNERDREAIQYLADQAAISIEKVRFYDDQRNYEIHLTDILLDAIDRIMSDKKGHSRRVAHYANIMAKALNLPEEKKRKLYFASLLHDIGFLRISPERTFEQETFIAHPTIGYEMLHPINFYSDIAPYVLFHHERYDGSGYPENLKGTSIPLESRIIAIAEAFDSMVSRASYKVPVNFDFAVSELVRNKGRQFDPELVDLFLRDVRAPLD